MSFDSEKIKFNRERIDVVEIDLDFCSLSFGNLPCTASGSGDDKCYNTLETCQDTANYTGGQGGEVFGIIIDVNGTANTFERFDGGSFIDDGFTSGDFITAYGFNNSENNNTFEIDGAVTASTIEVEPSSGLVDESGTFTGTLSTKKVKTYRFCTQRSPHPVGINAIPSLKSLSTSPAVIDIKGGLGVRSSVSAEFIDHPSNDRNIADTTDGIGSINIDPYYLGRTYNPMERGTFWTKLRARNPNYQFRNMRVLSGYLSNGVYSELNAQTRYYVIDSMTVSGGSARLTGKDPLKLASSGKSQAPKPSTGVLASDITSTATTLTLSPSGVGNDEYSSSGKCLINKEVISFTRSGDTLTLTRAQNNTAATSHSADDTVQQCLEYSGDPGGRIDEIVKDLLINYADINSKYINSSEWAAETDTHLSYLLDGILVKPLDVNKILKELTKASPHYLWWDERSRSIKFTALKAPPSNATALNMDSNLISLSTTDKVDMRVSTISVNFGQFNPTEKLDEQSNYQQTYTRIDSDSIKKYRSNKIEVINSRWINTNNKAGAKKLASLIGRRFSNIPRQVNFSLDAKDSDGQSGLWVGKNTSINHRDIVDYSGSPVDLPLQITSAKESKNYQFSGIEFNYGDSVASDDAETGEIIYLDADEKNVNLYDKFVSVYGTPDASTEAVFIVELGAVIGSTSTAAAMGMGDWSAIPAGFTIEIQVRSGCFIVGMGGNGGNNTDDGDDGGLALDITEDCTIINNGIIGGGGGGGGGGSDVDVDAGGGGGAGNNAGIGGGASVSGDDRYTEIEGEDGTITGGGQGGFAETDTYSASGGNGGGLGQDGEAGDDGAGGLAGDAINENGNTVTYSTAGDIRGAIT